MTGLRRRSGMRIGMAGLALATLLGAGCGGDDLAALPEPPPSAATWLVTWAAAVLLLLVVAALITWPAWARRDGSRIASVVLGLQAAAAWMVVALGVAVSLRAWQLSGRSPEELPAESLIELGRLGDRGFSRIVGVSVAMFVALPAVVLTVAARFAGTERVAERLAASMVLAVQVGVWGALVLRAVLAGDVDLLAVVAAVSLPLTFVAAWACWPRTAVDAAGGSGSPLAVLRDDAPGMEGAR